MVSADRVVWTVNTGARMKRADLDSLKGDLYLDISV